MGRELTECGHYRRYAITSKGIPADIRLQYAAVVSDILDEAGIPGTCSGVQEIRQSLYQTGWS